MPALVISKFHKDLRKRRLCLAQDHKGLFCNQARVCNSEMNCPIRPKKKSCVYCNMSGKKMGL